MNLLSLKLFLLDGDGVLWRANDAVPELDRFFAALRQRSMEWALLTNNNTRTVEEYLEKLRGFGIEASRDQIYTSSVAAADYIRAQYGEGAAVHVVGMPALVQTMEEAGFCVSTGEKPPDQAVVAVVAGMDRDITHAKITVAMRLILNGAAFIATNTDPSFPTPDGLNPGTGMVIGALIGTTHVQPLVVGKPEPNIFAAALAHFGVAPDDAVMVGDRLDTDIMGAQRAGLHSVAVLTGVTTQEQMTESDILPERVFESIAEIADALSPLDQAPFIQGQQTRSNKLWKEPMIPPH